MHNFMLSICSTYWRGLFNGSSLLLQEWAGFWKPTARMTTNEVWGAQHNTQGRVFLLLFLATRISCVKGEAKKAFLSPVRNNGVFCLTGSRFPDRGLLYNLILHLSICYQSPKLQSTWAMTGYNWTREATCSKYVFVSHLNMDVLCLCSWAVL